MSIIILQNINRLPAWVEKEFSPHKIIEVCNRKELIGQLIYLPANSSFFPNMYFAAPLASQKSQAIGLLMFPHREYTVVQCNQFAVQSFSGRQSKLSFITFIPLVFMALPSIVLNNLSLLTYFLHFSIIYKLVPWPV